MAGEGRWALSPGQEGDGSHGPEAGEGATWMPFLKRSASHFRTARKIGDRGEG